MGFSPAQVYEMSMWEFMACLDGFNRAHGSNKPAPPTSEQFDAALAKDAIH